MKDAILIKSVAKNNEQASAEYKHFKEAKGIIEKLAATYDMPGTRFSRTGRRFDTGAEFVLNYFTAGAYSLIADATYKHRYSEQERYDRLNR